VPVEDSVGALGDLVRRRQGARIGLSEVSAATLRRAHAVHPVAAVQTEYSLWTRNPEIAVLDTCREIGAAFVAFSPLARAFLTGTLRSTWPRSTDKDIRRGMPRFAPATYAANLKLLPGYEALARRAGCTPAQLALAWVLAQGDHVSVIPGTSSLRTWKRTWAPPSRHAHARATAAAGRADQPERTVVGPRYNAAAQADVDTEDFAPGH
jgi:aryl-alcohol dehydrogenase-like predicted oxidoreductase